MTKKELEKKLVELEKKKQELEIQRKIAQVKSEIKKFEEHSKLKGLGLAWTKGAGIVGKKVGKGLMKVGENLSKVDITSALGVKGKDETKKKV